ncbi:hypothetical protein JCM8097_007894 [Rhodosporidiobolus ruineniae]
MFARKHARYASPVSLLAWTASLGALGATARNISTVPIPTSGRASLTRHDFPLGAYGSCGCAVNSTYFPTAALSQAAYASSSAFGPACGQCFNLTLVETVLAVPTWILNEEQRRSVVVKVTDKCAAGSGDPKKGWCGATDKKTNKANLTLHFDLSTPSPSIPLSFFPTNESFYGYSDFGSWIVDFETVSCENWTGWGNQSAFGIDPNLTSESGCCPANPLLDNDVCSSFSLKSSAASLSTSTFFLNVSSLLLAVFLAHSASV